MVTLPFESNFGSGLLVVCVFVFFLNCYAIFELCSGVVSMVSYGDYFVLLALQKNIIILSLLCVIFAWVIDKNGSEACLATFWVFESGTSDDIEYHGLPKIWVVRVYYLWIVTTSLYV